MPIRFVNPDGVKPEIDESSAIDGVIDCIHKVIVEKDVFSGHSIWILTGGHNYEKFGEERKREGAGGPVTIHEGVWIGSGAMIIGPCEIGKHSVIGAGAVVRGFVGEYEVWIGNPAFKLKDIPH